MSLADKDGKKHNFDAIVVSIENFILCITFKCIAINLYCHRLKKDLRARSLNRVM